MLSFRFLWSSVLHAWSFSELALSKLKPVLVGPTSVLGWMQWSPFLSHCPLTSFGPTLSQDSPVLQAASPHATLQTQGFPAKVQGLPLGAAPVSPCLP